MKHTSAKHTASVPAASPKSAGRRKRPPTGPTAAHKATKAEVAEMLQRLSSRQVECAAAFICALLTGSGCTTPAEEFLIELVSFYAYTDGALTPAFAVGSLKEFKLNFSEAKRTTMLMARRHPEWIKEAQLLSMHGDSQAA